VWRGRKGGHSGRLWGEKRVELWGIRDLSRRTATKRARGGKDTKEGEAAFREGPMLGPLGWGLCKKRGGEVENWGNREKER